MSKNGASCKKQWMFTNAKLATFKGEYRLWHNKWTGMPTVDRPKTEPSAWDHWETYQYYYSACMVTIQLTAAEAERLLSKLESTLKRNEWGAIGGTHFSASPSQL